MAEGANRHHHPYAPALEIIDYSGGHPDGNALRGGRVGSEIHQLHRIDEAQYHQIHRRMIRAIQIAVDQPPIICVKSRHVRHRSPAASVRIAMPSTVNLYRSLRVRANLEQNKSSENNPSYPSSHKFLLVTTAMSPKKAEGVPHPSRVFCERVGNLTSGMKILPERRSRTLAMESPKASPPSATKMPETTTRLNQLHAQPWNTTAQNPCKQPCR